MSLQPGQKIKIKSKFIHIKNENNDNNTDIIGASVDSNHNHTPIGFDNMNNNNYDNDGLVNVIKENVSSDTTTKRFFLPPPPISTKIDNSPKYSPPIATSTTEVKTIEMTNSNKLPIVNSEERSGVIIELNTKNVGDDEEWGDFT